MKPWRTVILLLVVTYLLTTAFLQVFSLLQGIADAIIKPDSSSSVMDTGDFVLWGLFAVSTIVAVNLLAAMMTRKRRSRPLKPPQGRPVAQSFPSWLSRALRSAPRFWFGLLFVICLISVIGVSLQPPGRGAAYLVLILTYWVIMWRSFRPVIACLTIPWMRLVWPVANSCYARKGAGVPDDQKQEQWPPPSVNG